MGNIRERRITSLDLLRSLCIKEMWYTEGSNEEYFDMLNKAKSLSNLTAQDIKSIAIDIAAHSDNISAEDPDEMMNVMYKIANDACYTVFEEV